MAETNRSESTTAENSSAVGNVAKMREALEAARDLILPQCNGSTKFARACGEVVNKIMSALAEPRRNCDVGTAEEREQRFETFCSLHHLPNGKGCYSCPAIPKRSPHAFHRDACRANWNQMPYEEGGEQ